MRILIAEDEAELAKGLKFLLEKNKFTTAHLMDKIWGQDSEADISVVWTYVGFLRKKLKELNAEIEIRTARGAGYFLEENRC